MIKTSEPGFSGLNRDLADYGIGMIKTSNTSSTSYQKNLENHINQSSDSEPGFSGLNRDLTDYGIYMIKKYEHGFSGLRDLWDEDI